MRIRHVENLIKPVENGDFWEAQSSQCELRPTLAQPGWRWRNNPPPPCFGWPAGRKSVKIGQLWAKGGVFLITGIGNKPPPLWMCGAQILSFSSREQSKQRGGGYSQHHQDHSGGPAGAHILSSGPLKGLHFDRFYKVFDVPESHDVYSENLLLFGCFLEPKRDNGSKSINALLLYKVFWTTFLQAPKRCFTNGFWCFAMS